MAGRNSMPISVNQTPQYGDKAALAKVAKATKPSPMTGTPTPTRGPGRPAGGGQAQRPAPPASGPSQQQATVEVSADHQAAFNDLARAYRTYEYWQNVLGQYPSEWSRMYAKEAQRNYEQVRQMVRSSTPYFS
jgi:hypothetical protein